MREQYTGKEEKVSISYQDAPLEEAAIRIQFKSTKAWDLAIPGLFYSAISNRYPGRQSAVQMNWSLSTEEGKAPQAERNEVAQFLSEDKKSLIQTGPSFLSIHKFKPYDGWERFRENIDLALDAYEKTGGYGIVERLSMAYVNKISLPSVDRMKLGDFFEFSPAVGSNLSQSWSSFIVGIEVPDDAGNNVLRITMTSSPLNTEPAAIALVLEYFTLEVPTVDLNGVKEWIVKAHQQIGAAFESTIKDTLRERFSGTTNAASR